MSRSSIFSICCCQFLFYGFCASFEPVSFGIIINDDMDQKPIPPVTLTLYWYRSAYQCTIEPSAPNRLYECDTDEATHVTPVPHELTSLNQMHLSSPKHIAIQSIIVWDDRDNYHEINSFCPINRSNVNTTNECQNHLSILSTIVQFPPNELLTPNESHQGFHRRIDSHQSANQSRKRRLPIDTGTDNFDPVYFEFTLSESSGSGIDAHAFEATVYWQEYSFSCNYNNGGNNPVLPGQTAVCNDSNALLKGDSIPLDQSFKFKLRYIGSHNDTMRIDSLRVYTVNGNYFEINEFCVPSVFNASTHVDAITPCDLYPHKYSLSNIPLDRSFVSTLYVAFRDEIYDPPTGETIASYANQAFAGNVRLLEPDSVVVKLNKTADGGLNAGVHYALYWDEYIIKCEDVDATVEYSTCSFATATKQIECNHETQFMLRVHNEGGYGVSKDTIIIESISVSDADTLYTIENFCIPNAFDTPQTGTHSGNCSNHAYSIVPKWSQACVGDMPAPDPCSDNSINIRFPSDFLVFNNMASPMAAASHEGLIENKDANIPATCSPTKAPSPVPTVEPTLYPTTDPTVDPTIDPTKDPTVDPTIDPTNDPTQVPTSDPTVDPTMDPTVDPTYTPTKYPTVPTNDPTADPTWNPTNNPTFHPSFLPTYVPTFNPTMYPFSTTEFDGDEDKLGSRSLDESFMLWFNENTTNKIISGVAVAILILICCLICYICRVSKRCCCRKPQDAAKPLTGSAHSLKSSSYASKSDPSANSNARSLSSADAHQIDPNRVNSVQLASMQSSERRKAPRKVSSITVPLHDEYIVQFNTKPFGMSWSTLKTDQYNLYVRKVEPHSIAEQNNIKIGHKLVALNGESIEGIGSKKIYEQVNAAGLPLSIMFRKRSKRQRSLRAQTVPSQSGEGYNEGSFDNGGAYDPLAPGTPIVNAQSPFIGINAHQRLSELQEAVITPPIEPRELPKPKDGGHITVAVSQLDLDELSTSSGSSADLMYVQHGGGGAEEQQRDTMKGPSAGMMSRESAVLQHAVQNSGDIPNPSDED